MCRNVGMMKPPCKPASGPRSPWAASTTSTVKMYRKQAGAGPNMNMGIQNSSATDLCVRKYRAYASHANKQSPMRPYGRRTPARCPPATVPGKKRTVRTSLSAIDPVKNTIPSTVQAA